MPKRDPHMDAHLEWIGFVRPTGLVVSAPALARAGAILPRDPEGQRLLRAWVAERRFHPEEGRFFDRRNTYLFLGDHQYWLMTHWDALDLDRVHDCVLNRPACTVTGATSHPAERRHRETS